MLRTIDLFCGAGGLSLGLQEAGFESVAAVEVDKDCVKTYSTHTSEAEILDDDIRDIDLHKFQGKTDIIVGGPPCQPFSSGGLREGDKDERDMVPFFIKAIELIKPYAFLMENVPGLAVGDRKPYLTKTLQAFSNLGFKTTYKTVSAEEYGVPQKRKRLIIVGIRDKTFRFPLPTHGEKPKIPYISIRDVLPPHQIGEPNPSIVTYAKKPHLRPSPHHGLLFNGGGRPLDLSEPAPTILASAGGNKTHFIDELNLVPEYHSYLMKGGKPRVGNLPGARRLTVLESAILQTFPKDLSFSGKRSSQYRQIGNAVPPKLAMVLGTALKKQINQGEVDTFDEFHVPAQMELAI